MDYCLADPSGYRDRDPRTKVSYGDPRYWSARYDAEKEPFDWYLKWEQLREALLPLLSPEAEVLVLGCGTSLLSEQLYAEGFSNITNIDRCDAAVAAMESRQQARLQAPPAATGKKGKAPAVPEPPLEARPPMAFLVQDAEELPQDWTGRFDLVLDKALLDSAVCGREKMARAAAVLSGVSRVLKAGGSYVCVSWAPPEQRWPMLAAGDHDERGRCKERPPVSVAYSWEISHASIARPLANPAADPKAKDKVELAPSAAFSAKDFVYHVYTCKKA